MSTLPLANGIGIYVHFPWCLKKCPYCDFLSVAVPSDSPGVPLSAAEASARLPHSRYADAVISELQSRLPHLRQPLPLVRSIFFGGGTPSLWAPPELGRVLAKIREVFALGDTPDLEVTVECNPTSFSHAHAQQLRAVGVNRVSLGVQGLDNDRLEFLGRLHDDVGGLHAVREALRAEMPRVSADLIYGLYNQSPENAVLDVERLLDTGIHHLSAYALTIEPGTRFGALSATGKLPLLSDALIARSYEAVSRALTQRGFRHYEISNFAVPGHESRHNLGYWQGRDYLGLGTGAYGTVTLRGERLRYRNLLSPERYLAHWLAENLPTSPFDEPSAEREVITPAIAHQEALLLGLRTEGGVDLAEISDLRGEDPGALLRRRRIALLLQRGRLKEEGTRLLIPQMHWLFADGIIRDLL